MIAVKREECIHDRCCFQPKEYPCIPEICSEYINIKTMEQHKKALLSEALSVIKFFAPNHQICEKIEKATS